MTGGDSRFEVLRELGRGGEGRVVAVRDRARDGAEVALKETHGARAEALRSEFEILARVRHPHLAPVYDFFSQSPIAEERGVAAYTRALVDGTDLYRALRDVGFETRTRVFEQILGALAHLHVAGIAHLDLKPDNVLVEQTPDGPAARIVDFGIAARIGAELEVVRGSGAYVAPEILEGAPVSASADLWAFGLSMGEVAIGRTGPITALAALAVAERVAALEHLGCPPSWAPVVAICVDLDPARRPKSAWEVARAWTRARGESIELFPPRLAPALVRSGGPIGRRRQAVRAACGGRAALVVTGGEGSGRLTFMAGLAHEARAAGRRVEAWPLTPGTATIRGFAEALGWLVPGADGLAQILGATASELASDAESVPGRTEASARWSRAVARAADAAYDRLCALAAPAGAASTGRPLLLVTETRGVPRVVAALLERMVREAEAAAGASKVGRAHLPIDVVLRADAWDGAAAVRLEPFDLGDVRAFVATRFGDGLASAGDALAAALSAASGGVPGVLEALAELLVAREVLVFGEAGWRQAGDLAALALPKDVAAAIAARVALLAERERDALGALAWFGGPVAADAVQAAVAAKPRLEELVAAGLVVVDAVGHHTLPHPALGAAVAAWVPEGGGQAAVARLGPGRLAALPTLVRARVTGDAALAIAAGREALALRGPEAAVEAAELAVGLLPADPEALAFRASLADLLGPRELELELLGRLAQSLTPGDPRRLDVESKRFWALTRHGDTRAVEAHGPALAAEARAAGRPLIAAEVLVHVAVTKAQRGAHADAEALLAEAAAGGSLPGPLRARIANSLGNLHTYRGSHQAALGAYEEARRLKLEEGDPVGERIAVGNVGLAKMALGRYGEAGGEFARSLALARQSGHRRGEAWSLLTLAELGLHGGAWMYARRRGEAAAVLAEQLGDAVVAGDAHTTLAEACLALGDRPAALASARSGRSRAEAAQNAITAGRAEVLVLLADPSLDSDARQTGLERRLGVDGLDPGTVSLAAQALVVAALTAGRAAEALTWSERALAAEALRAPTLHWTRVVATALRARRLVGDGVGARTLVLEARPRLEAFLGAWPALPAADGVDVRAEIDGPARRALEADAVVRLIRSEALSLVGDSDACSVPVVSQMNASKVLSDPGGVSIAGAGAAQVAAELGRALCAIVVETASERAFLVELGAAAEDPARLIEARDADGERIGDALKRLPEAALDAARAGDAPWRAEGPDGRGAVLALPWSVPIGEGTARGALVLQNRFVHQAFADPSAARASLDRLLIIVRIILLERALAAAQAEVVKTRVEVRDVEARSTEEIRTLRRELETTREQIGPSNPYPEIIFRSSAMKRMLRQVDRVLTTDLPAHLHGESGTGKELVARAIHDLGARAKGPFVAQNCTAIPPTLFESELFGHEKGAFTGAIRSTDGLFRRAHGGTLFLDEIGDLPMELQAKLLRVLETGDIRPVGSTRAFKVDVRIISATHRDLAELIQRGAFREDLYYRLNVVRIEIPALRDRPEDIPALVDHFLARRASESGGKRSYSIESDALKACVRYRWPGNVRQLENEITRAALLADDGIIKKRDLSPVVLAPAGVGGIGGSIGGVGGGASGLGLDRGTLRDRVDRLEAAVLDEALRRAGNNKSEVARELGLSRAGLNLKLKRLGVAGADEA